MTFIDSLIIKINPKKLDEEKNFSNGFQFLKRTLTEVIY
jgi:hypothetical protein